jgi:methionine-rich copper-binding protein CopC
MAAVFMQTSRQRRVVRVAVWVAVLGLLFGVLSSIIMATGADAHTALESVSPKDGSTVTTAPTRVVLTFSEPVSASFATVSVSGPSGEVGSGKAAVDGAVVTQALDAPLPNGSYTVAFRVVSDDGHPVSDRTTFRVAAAATATAPTSDAPAGNPAPSSSATPGVATPGAAAPSAAGSPDGADGSDQRTLRLGLAVGVGALAVAAGIALIAANRRRGDADPVD